MIATVGAAFTVTVIVEDGPFPQLLCPDTVMSPLVAPNCTTMMLVPWPEMIVAPLGIDQLYDEAFAMTLVMYVLVVPSHTVIFPVIAVAANGRGSIARTALPIIVFWQPVVSVATTV